MEEVVLCKAKWLKKKTKPISVVEAVTACEKDIYPINVAALSASLFSEIPACPGIQHYRIFKSRINLK